MMTTHNFTVPCESPVLRCSPDNNVPVGSVRCYCAMSSFVVKHREGRKRVEGGKEK